MLSNASLQKSKSHNFDAIGKKIANTYQVQRTIQETEYSEECRTTSFGSSQLVKSLDFTTVPITTSSSRGGVSSPRIKRKNSIVLLESNEKTLAIRKVKTWQCPEQHVTMDFLRQKIWERIQKCQQPQIDRACILEILVINRDEHEFKFDISDAPYHMSVKELTKEISQVYTQEKGIVLNNPYLSILVGRIRTQKLNQDIRLFELLNLIINGTQTIVIQEAQQTL